MANKQITVQLVDDLDDDDIERVRSHIACVHNVESANVRTVVNAPAPTEYTGLFEANKRRQSIGHLHHLNARIRELVERARATSKPDDDRVWKMAYDLLFSDGIYGSFVETAACIGLEVTWVDPDSGYDDDTIAVANAIDELCSTLSLLEPT